MPAIVCLLFPIPGARVTSALVLTAALLSGCRPGAECSDKQPCGPGLVCHGGICMTDKGTLEVRSSEAKYNVEKITNAVDDFFPRGGEDERCPSVPGQVEGKVGPTPPLSIDCNKGAGGRCIPASGVDGKDGYYAAQLWSDDPTWKEMEFKIEQGHFFHYSYTYDNTTPGECKFTVEATGDLDADGTSSRYWIECSRSRSGMTCGELQVENPLD